MKNSEYLDKLVKAINHHEKRGWATYFRKLRILPVILMQKLKLNKLVRVPLFYGDKMYVITNEIVSRSLIAFGYAEPEIIALMLHRLKEGSVVVDIGTHYGFEAITGAKIVGETGKVFAFEPNPVSFSIAQKNLKGDNISLHNLAVGDYDGVANMNAYDIYSSAMNSITNNAEFKANPWVRSQNGKVIQVKLVKLDTFFKDRAQPIDFIKCDVEGFEIQVIKGAEKLLTEDKPWVVLESDYRLNGEISERVSDLRELMEKFNYSAYDFDLKNGELKIEKLGKMTVGHPNILFMPIETT